MALPIDLCWVRALFTNKKTRKKRKLYFYCVSLFEYFFCKGIIVYCFYSNCKEKMEEMTISAPELLKKSHTLIHEYEKAKNEFETLSNKMRPIIDHFNSTQSKEKLKVIKSQAHNLGIDVSLLDEEKTAQEFENMLSIENRETFRATFTQIPTTSDECQIVIDKLSAFLLKNEIRRDAESIILQFVADSECIPFKGILSELTDDQCVSMHNELLFLATSYSCVFDLDAIREMDVPEYVRDEWKQYKLDDQKFKDVEHKIQNYHLNKELSMRGLLPNWEDVEPKAIPMPICSRKLFWAVQRSWLLRDRRQCNLPSIVLKAICKLHLIELIQGSLTSGDPKDAFSKPNSDAKLWHGLPTSVAKVALFTEFDDDVCSVGDWIYFHFDVSNDEFPPYLGL